MDYKCQISNQLLFAVFGGDLFLLLSSAFCVFASKIKVVSIFPVASKRNRLMFAANTIDVVVARFKRKGFFACCCC